MAGVDEVRYTGRCPRFGACSVNACPLDYRIRPTHPGDPEQTCKAPLQPRLDIAAQAEADGITLPWAGFRPDETARLKAGETLATLLGEWAKREEAKRLQSRNFALKGHQGRPDSETPGKTPANIGGATILAVLLIVKTALFWASLASGVLA